MNPNKTAKLLKEINKLTNEIDKLLKSKSPKAKRMLKSLASKGRELGIIISDDLTDKEVGEVIKKADKKTKQALIYAIQNEIPNLKSLHKGKKNFKLDKAYATKSKLSFAIAPDKAPLTEEEREAKKEKLKVAAKLKRQMKKAAEEKLRQDNPQLWKLLTQEEQYKKEEAKRWKEIKKLEDKKIREAEKKKHKEKIKALKAQARKAEAERQQAFNEERINAILDLRKNWELFMNKERLDIKDTLGQVSQESLDRIIINKNFEDIFPQAKLNLDKLAEKYGFNPDTFLSLVEYQLDTKNLVRAVTEQKFENAEDTVKFLNAIAMADPYQQMYQHLFKELTKYEKLHLPKDSLYVLPQGKLNELGVEFKSGVTNEQLENLKNTLEIFKVISDSPTGLTEEAINESSNIITVYAKLQILCVELMAKVMSVIQATSVKVGGESWDNTFWWFATYRSKQIIEDGHTWVNRGFVVDWKGVHTRIENFLPELTRVSFRARTFDIDSDLHILATDFMTLAHKMKQHYDAYKNHIEEGELGIERITKDAQGNLITDRVFNTEAFKKTAKIGEQYQNYLIQAQSQLTELKNYCQKAIEIAQNEIRRFARNRYK